MPRVTITLPSSVSVTPIYNQAPDMPHIGQPVPAHYVVSLDEPTARALIDELVRTFGMPTLKKPVRKERSQADAQSQKK